MNLPKGKLLLLLSLFILNSCEKKVSNIEPQLSDFEQVFKHVEIKTSSKFKELLEGVGSFSSNVRTSNSTLLNSELGLLYLNNSIERVSNPDQYAPNYSVPIFSLESEAYAAEILSFVATQYGYNGVILSFIPDDGLSYNLQDFTGWIKVLNLDRELEVETYYYQGEPSKSSKGRAHEDDCELSVSYVYDPSINVWGYDIELVCSSGSGSSAWPEDTGTPIGGNNPWYPDAENETGGGSSGSGGEGGSSGSIGISPLETDGYSGDGDLNDNDYETTECSQNLQSIPRSVTLSNGTRVRVTFGTTESDGLSANNLVAPSLLNAIVHALNKASNQVTMTHIHISATTNGIHGIHSNHYKKRAVDISRINNQNIYHIQNSDLVRIFQESFDSYSDIRENFGPSFQHKQGSNYNVGGHKDHIHISTNNCQ